ncbi:MAG: hypothetical protein AB7O46_00205 [Xanthobacteraceae bacterium]
MPEFSLSQYIALKDAVDVTRLEGAALERAREALYSLRKFFPSIELWEREQAARSQL